ncbi:hypothetical protein SCHIN_v1c07380 [Spiroplasma chinense]|uniref:Uncharacterized protein n=1 Tax=Spiroplasma chinense TaxID=216932 RepID=A0A5B9Y566_9MOLU|nr:YwaF family protein [Spiroplasma chinense]QEH61933.1 hypothetical protein SCHIN_v1c07380 [Spiroplasma chinense]
MQGNLAWAIAIILALFMWASLSMFPKYYKDGRVFLSIRIILIIFLVFNQIERTVYLVPIHTREMIESGYLSADTGEWGYVPNYFLMYFCTLSAWAAIILLIKPNKWVMDTFFPFMLMGPIVTFIFPTEKPYFWSTDPWDVINWFTFYFGHACTLFAAMYLYLYGHTNYKFGRDAIFRSAITAIIVVCGVEVWNQYFGSDYIVGEVAGALELNWPRPYIMLFILTVGTVYLGIGLSFAYFFKPIYGENAEQKVHNTWWENFLGYVEKTQQSRKNEIGRK